LANGGKQFVTEMKDARIAGDDRRLEAARPKTFREKYGDRLADQMLLLTNQPDDDLLPNFCHELAGRPKGISERILLQREVDLAARAQGVQPFKVTPSQILALKTFDFAGNGYTEVGTGLLPFSVTPPPDATSASARRMLSEDRARADTFDMSGEGDNGALTTSDVNRLRNNKGYVVVDWVEARAQARSYAALVGALLGTGHQCVLNYSDYLSRLDDMESRLRWDLDSTHGQRFPPLMVFHTQLIWRSWFVKQLSTGQTRVIAAPDFCHGLDAFDVHNNLSWLPSVSNVPALQALTSPSRNLGQGSGSQEGGGNSNLAARATPATTASASPTPAAPAGNRHDPGRPVRNTDRDAMFTGNIPFAANVRTHRVQQAIALAGSPPRHMRSGVSECMCVSWHAKGVCFEHCDRVADHLPMNPAESTEFHAWCAIAFA
jgi:hypothetical protein